MMAHFAEVVDGVVKRVLIVDNSEEYRGNDFLSIDLGLGGTWIQTSYNGTIRKNFAGIGFTFDPARDAFYSPQPYPSWIFRESSCTWEAPNQMPSDGARYEWDEATLTWIRLQ